MIELTRIAEIRARRDEAFRLGTRIALVPTMGALHDGHITLVQKAATMADEVWASVFVNPTQFGPGEDFERYPRDLETDRARLAASGCTVLFAPTTAEMYPRPPAVALDVPTLSSSLCGAHRPGHFGGVALVVTKLLAICLPQVAVFGAKDWQQAAVVRRLVEDLNLPVSVHVAPTRREADGLAMSSRNSYLSRDDRRAATVLKRALDDGAAAVSAGERSAPTLERCLASRVATEPRARLHYAAAVDPDTLLPRDPVGPRVLLALAVHFGDTRLIDNCLVEVA